MEFSLKRPTKESEVKAKVGVATFSATDDTGTSARAYLRTAAKAKEAANYTRETQLIEKAISSMGTATPNVLRRYAAALYKCGEFRAASAILNKPICLEDGGKDYVERLQSQLNGKISVPFHDILSLA